MHEGHRERLRKKLEVQDVMEPHEILESLLFNAYPRKNTNPIAHALLTRFMTVTGVLEASVSELMQVEDVGPTVAAYIRTVGLCLKRMREEKEFKLRNRGEFIEYAIYRMRGRAEEFLEIYLTEKSGRILRTLEFTSYDANMVTVTSDKIAEAISAVKPYAVVVAHNHLNGSSAPSGNDDIFTRRMQIVCRLYNVELLDHIIYASDDDCYSYNFNNRLEYIKTDPDINVEASRF